MAVQNTGLFWTPDLAEPLTFHFLRQGTQSDVGGHYEGPELLAMRPPQVQIASIEEVILFHEATVTYLDQRKKNLKIEVSYYAHARLLAEARVEVRRLEGLAQRLGTVLAWPDTVGGKLGFKS